MTRRVRICYNFYMSDKRENGKDEDERGSKFFRIAPIVLAVLGAVGLAVCIAVYIATRNDVLFIPMALFGVLAMIAFTYVWIKR